MTNPLERLDAEFGPGLMVADADAMAPYLADWFGHASGAALAVLRPRNTADVQAMVRTCGRLGLGIVPQGGNTGLVGGGLAQDPAAHVCLSLSRLDRIRTLDLHDYATIVEAGCVLQAVKDAAATRDLHLPISLGAQGTSQIGGLISTNAGGLNVLRHGMTRDHVLGLEVVLADGRLWDGLTTLRKNNTGPDLKQLFIGAEGTFGIITAAALRLLPSPTASATALIALDELDAAMAVFHRARRDCSDLLSAFEFLTPAAMAIARADHPDPPDVPKAGAYVLIELAAPGPVDLDALLQTFLEHAAGDGLIRDGILARSGAQADRLWALREAVNTGQARLGPFLRSDVSVRLSDLPRFVADACAAIESGVPGARAVAYGHFGDGNVHLNVLPPDGSDLTVLQRAEDILYAQVDACGGSISAEHGIGRFKRAAYHARQNPVARDMLAALKAGLDPDGRMNPGALHG